jgi:DeoR family transcriptional regulator, fructose operon transcriptional repressor
MANQERLNQITQLVDERGFISVSELSEILRVSEMTIRRDLELLDVQGRLQRTYGGAASLRAKAGANGNGNETATVEQRTVPLLERVDVLIATALNPKYDGLLLDSIGSKKLIPIVAESLSIGDEATVVAVDNYQAGIELGRWAGNYAQEHWGGKAHILDLTYYLANTQTRSRGFIHGVTQVLPTAEVVLSLDAQSRYDTAYRLTRDALTVHEQINIIFAINDIIAWGAINACKDLGIDPDKLIVLPFGLEGDTLRDALQNGNFCKAGLAMFPEIVGSVCIEAAIGAYNHRTLPAELVTPHAVLTAASLPDLYEHSEQGWTIRWDRVTDKLKIPLPVQTDCQTREEKLPRRIGFIVPFSAHEWYQNLVKTMRIYSDSLGCEFEIVDVHQSLKDEVDFTRREIAEAAANMVEPGDVILIDGGPLANYLAEALLEKQGITIITNAIPIFEILRANPELMLMLTGGAYRSSSQMLVGPTAEGALRELRADKLFLTVTGISLDFGLSHTNISEVTIKQAMIHSAREVILLADHTFFGQDSVIQVASPTVVHKLVTDDALPASVRLDLTKLGIEIILANA